MSNLKLLLLKFIYSIGIFTILLLIFNALGIQSWWLALLVLFIGWYLGTFLATFIHGVNVGDLKHIGSENLVHHFTVLIARGGTRYHFQGSYFRETQLPDLILQTRIYNSLNRMPGSRDINDYLINKLNSQVLSVFIDDPGGSIFGATEVKMISLN